MDLRASRRRVAKFGFLAAGLLLIAAPAFADCGGANGTLSGILLEVHESPPQHAAPGGPTMPGAFSPGIGQQLGGVVARIAEATEVGSVVGCGTLDALTGAIEFHAQSRIPFAADGLPQPGVINGVFQIDAASGANLVGKISGTLAFVIDPACGGTCPLATVSGVWNTLGKNRTAGQFGGVAFVPIPLGCTSTTGCFYFDPIGVLGGGFVALTPDEYSKQFETGEAKFVFTFFQ